MEWLPLSLLCAFSLASADAFSKKYLVDYSARELVLVRLVYAGLMLSPLFWFNPFPPVPPVFWGWMALALPLEIIAQMLYMEAIRTTPLSLTLPYLAFTPVFTTLTSQLLLGERVSPHGLAGILLVVAGTYLLNLEANGRRRSTAVLEPFRAVFRERGSRLMLVVALIFSLTSVLGKIGLQYVPPWQFAAFYFAALSVLTLTLFGARHPATLKVLWRRPGAQLLVAGFFVLMIVTHFLAIQRVEVAYMISVKRTSILFGIFYGAVLFGERSVMRHILAGGLMVSGVALIAV